MTGRQDWLPPFRQASAIPGFGLALGYSLTWLGLIVLVPLAVLVFRALELGPSELWHIISDERTRAALRVSFGLSFLAAMVNGVAGLAVAWVLVRYRFPGRRLLDALVDLPFALPTAVAGIALTALYAPNGWLGSLLKPIGIKVAYTPFGIFIALVFIGLPFVVRTLQPVLEDIDHEVEEAAASLGARRWQTVFQVLLPTIFPAWLAGFALALARAVGEYGSVIFIAGNIPYVSEIAPLLIIIRLEEYNYAGATAIATAMLFIAFVLLLIINLLQGWTRRRLGHV
jgi:sulfate/thiosulfate transport system permease protein